MIVFAYDGSLNGDWVAHYAVRFAANTPSRTLRLVHVLDDASDVTLPQRIERIADECALRGVTLERDLVARAGADTAAQLLASVPPGATVVAGTRARPRNFALLAGTVTARLLEHGRGPVVAIRVVHPGLLGQPGRVLLPLSVAGTAAAAMPLLQLLAPDLRHLHVLIIHALSRVRLRLLRGSAAARLLADASTAAVAIETELDAALGPHHVTLDASIVLSNDVPTDIMLEAARRRARLVCVEAARPSWTRRLVYGDPIERLLRDTSADVALYRSPA